MHTTISRSRPKCGRKPLREIHVSGKNVPATDAPSKPGKNSTVSCRGSPKGEGTMRRDGRGGDGDGVLDKLLLVRSDLAGLVREVRAITFLCVCIGFRECDKDFMGF
ncbi:hypothetical protein MLD38_028914 [Melastoma candidum]|uniref:Uncharacterized protein n=1 Tax=Melastoma candidum TaxID=119954 RepID=A0ACB9N2D6_9MYRT|nr:hypothetical protein MLD38_028914 [Melastoma candidum]